MARSKAPRTHTPVEAVKHKERRSNIPTEELRDFVAEDEKAPKTILYPRDPSLDPQLLWKGKDEQDQHDLEVPALPIYIQEKIQPKALIENLRQTARAGEPEPELKLFDDFNGIEFDDLIEFYQHDQNWSNRMILGDSLHVMTSLAEKEGLKGKVQMIYVDPPYGIKFGSNWQVSTRKRDVKDGKAEDATRQPEQIKAFRDTWELGIHSYLSYLRDRFTVARDLLTESGSIFVQIGDENVHLVRSLLDEVFGSQNFFAEIIFAKTTGFSTEVLSNVNDYILWYAKERGALKYRQLFTNKSVNEDSSLAKPVEEIVDDDDLSKITRGRLAMSDQLTSQGAPSTTQAFEFKGRSWEPPYGLHWKTTVEGLGRLAKAGRIARTKNSLRYVRYIDDFPVAPYSNLWLDTGTGSFTESKVYVVQTNTKVIERCLLMTTDPGDLVLDPTCGSGTTAVIAEQQARRWITIDTSRVALALARTRLMAARYPYYILADSPEGVIKDAGAYGPAAVGRTAGSPVVTLSYRVEDLPKDQQTPGATASGIETVLIQTQGDVRKGFVYKHVPHVTLKSIANNPDIKEGMSREEIDAAIARHADTEVLYDQPYEDPKRVRVTGPFTVESLSPHRLLSEEQRPKSESVGSGDGAAGGFEAMILDNLRKAGVQNTFKDERLKFERLEPFAGSWIHAEGEYTDKEGKHRRVAISIGPEHGTVGPDQVKEAAKEAVQGVGFDVLIVCGFAFDPHVSEEAKRYGKLTVLPARMNPDLSMGDELLKKTGAGNLFMIFGEPDIDIATTGGMMTVEIKGLDVYDPTTGQIRSSSTDDIACWFIDTNYNGESFFVRHAYFTGADHPYEKLKRALRADINEEAWESLYSTKSRPFTPPTTNKIAIKVINHYGDEALRVYDIAGSN